MPQPVQNSLIHVLLLWTTILSIIQVVIIILFVTNGQHAPSQHNNTVAPESRTHFQANQTPSKVQAEEGTVLGKGKMLTFKAMKDTDAEKIKWVASTKTDGSLFEEKDDLVVTTDGYYFLNLQVTMKPGCNNLKVYLRVVRSDTGNCASPVVTPKDVLWGSINKDTCTTGVLSKVEVLSAGHILCFSVDQVSEIKSIDDSQSVTHLDVIYISKP